MNRRDVLRTATATALAGALPGWLAGCAEEADVPQPPPAGGDSDTVDTDVVDTDVVDTPAPPDPSDTDLAETDLPDTDPPTPVTLFDADAIPLDPSFPEAVRAGAPTADGVILVTRTTGADPVRVRVWAETATPGEVVLVWDADAAPNDGGYLRAEITGLSAGARWRYGFFRPDAAGALLGRSDLGAFQTAPAAGAQPVFTVALMSCNGDATGRNDAVGRLAAHPEVDAIAHVGDMAYNDGAYSAREYRASWAEWMTSPGYRRGLATSPLYATWDDHEVDNNWDAETIDPVHLANAATAFTENVPLRAGPAGLLWGSHRWGDTAELFVLDCRTERRPSTRGRSDLYVSRAQMDWLKAALTASTARFKLILNSVPITGMPPIWDLAAADRWEGYPLQRDELLDHIAGIEGVWFLSGDFHVCFVSRVDPGAAGVRGRVREIAVTSGNVNPLGAALVQAQFAFHTSQPHLCTVRCDPAADTLTVSFYDPATDALVWERTYPRT